MRLQDLANRWFYSPRLELLESRLPPGDALPGVLWGMELVNAGWPGLSLRSPGLPTEPGLHVVRPRPPEVDWMSHPESECSVARPESAKGVLAGTRSMSSASFEVIGADPLATPFDLAAQAPVFRRQTGAAVTAGRATTTDAITAPATSTVVRPSNLARVNQPHTVDAFAVPAGLPSTAGALPDIAINQTQKDQVTEQFGKLPLSFEENVGQFDDRVDFVTRAGGMTTFLTPTAAVFAIQHSESEMSEPRPLGSGLQDEPLADAGMSEPRPLGSGLRGEPLADARGSETTASPGVALYMEIVGANPAGRAVRHGGLPGIVNYFIGNDPSQWHSNIATFGRVEYQDVYPGIDLMYYGNNGALEYDFIVSPGADPNVIALDFAGADSVEIDPHGNLVLHTAVGYVVQHAPLTYQQEGDSRQERASRYVLNGTRVRFEVGGYDPSRPLVIDPLVMGYSTYLGGSVHDEGYGIAVDDAGNAHLTGVTTSGNFPTTPGAFKRRNRNEIADAFVTKLNPNGSALMYSTFLGGSSNYDSGSDIAVDVAGDVYVTGVTVSKNFPTTPGAFDTVLDGTFDAFVSKLNANGSALVYSTLLGGSDADEGHDLAVDGAGNAYVCGTTTSTNFPTTPDAFGATFNGGISDAFVTKVNASGSSLVYSAYLGGSNEDQCFGIAVDAAGNAYVTGFTASSDFPTTPGAFDITYNGGSYDVFVTRLTGDGTSLAYCTFLGESNQDTAGAIAADAAGNAYVTGYTNSPNFPTTPGAFDTTYNIGADAFVAKLNPEGATLVYSTFLGGSGVEFGYGVAVDGNGNAYVTGQTTAVFFPTTPDAFDTAHNGGIYDAYLTKLNALGSDLIYSTYLGGSKDDLGLSVALDGNGSAYVIGRTESSGFPTTPGAFDTSYNGGVTDTFVTKFAEV